MKSKTEIVKELTELVSESHQILLQEINNRRPADLKQWKLGKLPAKGPINQKYQNWYSRSTGIIRSLMPERLEEFVSCYEPDSKRKIADALTYTIKDYLMGVSITRGGEALFDHFGSFSSKMQHQMTIITALLETLGTRIADVESVLQAKLFADELDTATELARRGHFRAAGAVAGVVLEGHLGSVSKSRGIKLGKKSPTISDFNEALKAAGVLDVPTWRYIQRLGDIRNLSVHSKERDPTNAEIEDLIVGVRKMVGELN